MRLKDISVISRRKQLEQKAFDKDKKQTAHQRFAHCIHNLVGVVGLAMVRRNKQMHVCRSENTSDWKDKV